MAAADPPSNYDATVVIPTHDRWPLLRVALDTVLNQRGTRVRAVVVDDCSSDETPEALNALDDQRVLVLRQDVCCGVSAARNRGLAEVRTPWVAFLDDDDVFGPDHVAGMLGAAAERADSDRVGLVYSGHIVTDGQRSPLSAAPAVAEDGVATELLSSNVLGPPSAVLLRTEAVRDIGGFDEGLSILADWDMWIRISQRYAIRRCPNLQVGYMRHPNNMHLAGDRFAREMTSFAAKHGAAAAACGRRLPGDTFPLHVAGIHRASGRRLLASRWYLRSFAQSGRPRHLALAAGVLLGERAIARSGLRTAVGPAPVVGWLRDLQRVHGV